MDPTPVRNQSDTSETPFFQYKGLRPPQCSPCWPDLHTAVKSRASPTPTTGRLGLWLGCDQQGHVVPPPAAQGGGGERETETERERERHRERDRDRKSFISFP